MTSLSIPHISDSPHTIEFFPYIVCFMSFDLCVFHFFFNHPRSRHIIFFFFFLRIRPPPRSPLFPYPPLFRSVDEDFRALQAHRVADARDAGIVEHQPVEPHVRVEDQAKPGQQITSSGALPFSTNTIAFVEKRSEEHTSELQSQSNLVCRLLLA